MRRLVAILVAAAALVPGYGRAGVLEDVEAVIFGGAKALRQDASFRALEQDTTRWKALRESVALMLTAVDETTSRAAEVVLETPLEPRWSSPTYANQLAATAARMGRAYEDALGRGARSAVATFQLDEVAGPGDTLEDMLHIGVGLESHSGLEGISLQAYRRPETITDASELDVIARELRQGLPVL